MTAVQREKLIALFHEGHGVLTAERVVADAASEDSVLHGLFQWDNAKAAHAHRLDQARSLIRSVEFVPGPSTMVEIRAPYFVRDPDKPGDQQGYVSTVSLQGEEKRARAVLLRELSRIQSSVERALALSIGVGLETEFDRLLEQVTALTRRIKLDDAA